ncbi:MAG TPA: hypothetical protein VKT99_09785 [Xanthobacteraceae bacterium]|jgi:peptidoglycan hydrolase-like protein with peptidoglycan-binding domain|nr:hypothetical protein [Xanthobacteraceae bacterium]
MPLTSNNFLGEKADPARTRLERCLTLDPYHIPPGSKGPEVARIQRALAILGWPPPPVEIDQSELDQQFYGDTTAAAVAAFKRKWGILNYENKIDPIVGIKTLTRLDQMMADWEKRHAPPPPSPPPPVVGAAGVQIGPVGVRRSIIESYYRNCGLETVGPGQVTTGVVQSYSTFDELLDVLLARNEKQQIIVNHGNRFKGLIIPFARGTRFDGTGNVIFDLSLLADQEEQGTLDPKGFGVLDTSARMGVSPQTTLGMVHKLVEIRKKQLILHFRACTIGVNRGMVSQYKEAFHAPLVTFHSSRLFYVVVRPAQIKAGHTSAGEFAKHTSTVKKRYRLFQDPIGLLSDMLIGVVDLDGHTNVESGSLMDNRTPDEVTGWAQFLLRQWRQGNAMEFVVPVMWENAELTFHCPLEEGWRQKLEWM